MPFIFTFLKWLFKLAFRVLKLLFMIIGSFPVFQFLSRNKGDKDETRFDGKVISDKNFIVLSKEFGKDSTTAYYKSRAFSYADVPTFEAVDDHYAKDRYKVYYCNEYRDARDFFLKKRQTIIELRNADPATFVSSKNGFGKDHNTAWFIGHAFEVADVSSFTSITNHFARDDQFAYLNLEPIAGSDGKTFELLDHNFAKDAINIYYYGYTGEGHNICILPCDRQSFEILDYRFSKDNVHVFFLGFTIKDADAATFQILSEGYSKDKSTVYFREKKVADANPYTFEVFKENGNFGHDFNYAKDDVFVFMDDKKVAGADVASFEVLGENYGRDKKHIYHKTKIVKSVPDQLKNRTASTDTRD